MAELDDLPRRIQNAIAAMQYAQENGICHAEEDLDTVCSELLRLFSRAKELARENQTLRNAGVALLERAERAESELAALKAKIAAAPIMEFPLHKPTTDDGWRHVIESAVAVRDAKGHRIALLDLGPQ